MQNLILTYIARPIAQLSPFDPRSKLHNSNYENSVFHSCNYTKYEYNLNISVGNHYLELSVESAHFISKPLQRWLLVFILHYLCSYKSSIVITLTWA